MHLAPSMAAAALSLFRTSHESYTVLVGSRKDSFHRLVTRVPTSGLRLLIDHHSRSFVLYAHPAATILWWSLSDSTAPQQQTTGQRVGGALQTARFESTGSHT